jgi:hypothetical protein
VIDYLATVGPRNAEWLTGTLGPTWGDAPGARVINLGDGKVRIPALAACTLSELPYHYDGVICDSHIWINGDGYALTSVPTTEE